MTFCDTYLELIKARFWQPEAFSNASRLSAQATLWEVFRQILGFWSPFVPFVTEALYQAIYRPVEGTVSLHASTWPEANPAWLGDIPEMTLLLSLLDACRTQRTAANISQGKRLPLVTVDETKLTPDQQAMVRGLEASIQSLARVDAVAFAPLAGEGAVALSLG
jgi:valyl-tRNA synthetase